MHADEVLDALETGDRKATTKKGRTRVLPRRMDGVGDGWRKGVIRVGEGREGGRGTARGRFNSGSHGGRRGEEGETQQLRIDDFGKTKERKLEAKTAGL